MSKKFRLPRKVKKQYKKDDPLYAAHWPELWPGYREACYNWFYHKDRVIAKAMRVIREYNNPLKNNGTN